MPSEWQTVSIAELIGRGAARLQTGPFGSQLHKHDYVESGVKVIPTEAIGRGRIRRDVEVPQVGEAKAQELERHKLTTGDILFARRGIQATGLAARIDESDQGALCGTGAILLRVDESVVDSRFLSMCIAGDESYEWLRANSVGAVMPNLNSEIISQLRIPLPPLQEQRAIAETLGALDDRIDNLRQTNATLEAIAQALFKSWFVDFDGVPPEDMQESELGLIPKGWQVASLDDAFEINPKRELKKGAVAPYLDMASVPTSGAVPDPPVMREFSSGTKFVNGDTLLARITPCLENGKTAYVDFLDGAQTGWGSTEFIVLRPKHPLPAFFGYLLARREEFRSHAIRAMSGTSGRQRVEVGQLHKFMVAVPDESTGKAFGDVVHALQKTLFQNATRIETLAALRDTLLPRLISGRLRLPLSQCELAT